MVVGVGQECQLSFSTQHYLMMVGLGDDSHHLKNNGKNHITFKSKTIEMLSCKLSFANTFVRSTICTNKRKMTI